MRFVKIALAAVLVVAAAAAHASSNYYPTGRVAAVARTPGVAGSVFRSDFWAHNPNSAEVFVDMYLDLSDGTSVVCEAESPTRPCPRMVLPPNGTVEYRDVLLTYFGVTNGAGAIYYSAYDPTAPTPSDESRSILVQTRTYNLGATPATFGQGIPGLPVVDATSRTGGALTIIGASNANGFRTNFGFAESFGPGAGALTTVEVKVFDETSGTQVGSTTPVSVLEYRWFQADAFAFVGAPGSYTNARIELKVTAGEGAIVAYGSLIDGRIPAGHTTSLNDPTYIPASEKPLP